MGSSVAAVLVGVVFLVTGGVKSLDSAQFLRQVRRATKMNSAMTRIQNRGINRNHGAKAPCHGP